MFKKYNLEITKKLEEKKEDVDWGKTLNYHKLMISRIQHERLIHLIITTFVGICFVLCFLAFLIAKEILLGILVFVLLFLFTAYIFHYRFLENTTQSWYKIEDLVRTQIK